MDLAFTPEEQKFREDIRAWVGANLPTDISHKVHNALHLTPRRHAALGQNSGQKRLAGPWLAQGVWRPGLERGAKAPV
jgi:hypothetical protein